MNDKLYLSAGNSTEEVNPVTEDIERMNIMDPKEARQTNQDNCEFRYLSSFLKQRNVKNTYLKNKIKTF